MSGAIATLGSSSPQRDEPDFQSRPVLLSLSPLATKGVIGSRRIRVLGAWRVTSNDHSVGGISAMAWQEGRLVALTDTGSVIEARPDFARLRATGTIGGVAVDCGYDGQKSSRDSESLAIDPDSRIRWIGFESRNAICRIDHSQPGAAVLVVPRAMATWPQTGGPEAMTRLSDGRFVVIAERPRRKGPDSPMLVFDRDPVEPGGTVRQHMFAPPDGYRPTEVVALPDQSLLVLVRSYRFPFSFDGRLLHVSAAAWARRRVTGQTVASFTAPLNENFEALAITQVNGRTYVWAMTDDNFMPNQRTILVLMEYIGGP